MVGADDLSGKGYRLIPRLPSYMTRMEAKDISVSLPDGVHKISFVYSRGAQYPVFATDGNISYSFGLDSGEKPEYVRFGPFQNPDIKTNGKLLKTEEINGRYYTNIII